MIFGPEAVASAEGAVLAHSVTAGARKWRKGRVLDAQDIAAMLDAGLNEITTARLEQDDLDEDAAAALAAAALAGAGVEATTPFTGRVNLTAARPGVMTLGRAAIDAFNAVHPGVTVATLPAHTRVSAGMMLATVKIIPYAVPRAAVDAAVAALGDQRIAVAEAVIDSARLILTRTPGFAQKLLDKGARVTTERMAALGVAVTEVVTVPHATDAVAAALGAGAAPLTLILGASATSDVADVCPAGLVAAGGVLTRFGMPVDPGNLLFLGDLCGAPVVGLPGCARSPAANGADWVLERLVCGLPVSPEDIAGMGVGGLLKEIPIRPQPRVIRPVPRKGPKVAAVLLAAGAGRRMRGADKLLEPIGGVPLIAHAAGQLAAAKGIDQVHVVLPPDRPERAAALDDPALHHVPAERASEGMGASLRAGISALDADTDAVVIALADMPEVTCADIEALVAAYDPDSGAEIIRALTEDGIPGHPVLFGRRFFEALADVTGDTGARDVLRAAPEHIRDVTTRGSAAVTDLDTPEQWAAWRAMQQA